ncbi:uncharacterized protein LOC111335138 [Stylophora pistillata]|uniref:uncharacterized protein LOC111335138 n=1 Tax=Stylophora pistillata TaxID=50429 RepID=UPI000C0431A0|nr:uncharacterized protein LOC111335138 [Stylophora pistillata]
MADRQSTEHDEHVEHVREAIRDPAPIEFYDQEPSASYCRGHIGIPCILEYSKNGWFQICEFTHHTCNLNCSVNNCSSNCYPVRFCAKSWSKAYRPMVDHCADTIYDERHHGWSSCNATKCNLTSAQQTFGTNHTCHYEGDQCSLTCSGINCTQTCKEKSIENVAVPVVRSSPSLSPASVTARPSKIRSQPLTSPLTWLALSLSRSSLPSPSSIPPPSSSSPSNAIQKLANDYVFKLEGLDSSRNTSLQEAVNVFESFVVRFENMTKPLEGLFTRMEVQTGRESLFKVAIAFEEFALNYSKQHLKGLTLSEEIVSHKMVVRIQKAYRHNASHLYLKEHEWKLSINISSSNFEDNGSVVVGCFYKNLHEILPNNRPHKDSTGNTRYVGTRITMAAMDPTPEKLLENVFLKFRNVEVKARLVKIRSLHKTKRGN